MTGYTPSELDDIQAKWSLRFPPDLVALLRERRSVIPDDDFDWLTTSDDTIRAMIDWPLEGFLFDVAHGLWWPEWGAMPVAVLERQEKLRSIFAGAPKLIPVYGHRCIPETPHEAGNPIFSVYQMDVIHYGANLEHYIAHETNPMNDLPWPPIKTIPFWSRAVAFNTERFASGGGFAFFNKGNVLPEP